MRTAVPAIRSRGVVPVLAFGGIVTTLVQTAVVPLLPELPRLTGSAPVDVGWVVTITLLAAAVATPLLGRAGDMYGKRRVLLLSLAALTLGSLLCGLTSDLAWLIVGRGLQGVGAAVIPLAISILRDLLPPERTGSAVALMSSTVGIGAAFGLPLAALLVQYADWHAMFWATTGLGALVFVLAWRFVDEVPGRSPGRFDIPGALGLAAGMVCLLLAVSKGGDWGWADTRTLGLAGAGLVVLAAWGRYQWGAALPLVDLRLAARPAVLLPHVAALLAGFAFYANSLVTAQLVQAPEATGYGLGLSVVAAGLCLLPAGVIMTLCAPVSARISAARGAKVTLAIGAAVIALGYVVRIADSRELWAVIAGAAVVSLGTALAYSALPMLVMRAVPIEQTAAANGLNVLMRTIGQALCSAAVASVLASHTRAFGEGVTAPTLDGYRIAFVLAGAVALLACAAACFIPRHARQPRTPESETVVRSTSDAAEASGVERGARAGEPSA
ncbi:MFS transporter [Yinghuangia seranimata]|uniref:MFS transporter n=1 Tax=Yinghuangia seranimata TaxID=408067 RepID=UPI00248C622C|nr:MFS transporter [Yinghuangia seranimata]MDI2131054.1 MFS transporter [Yinghuangia seranimata]